MFIKSNLHNTYQHIIHHLRTDDQLTYCDDFSQDALQVATLFVPSVFAAGTCLKNRQALKSTRTRRREVPRQNTQKQDLKSYAQRCRLAIGWVI